MIMVALSLIVLLSLFGGLNAAPAYKESLPVVESLNKNDKKQYIDCHDVRYSGGYNVSGIYTLHLSNSVSYQVQCEHTAAVSSTVIQQRVSSTENFKRGFSDYATGFGNPQTNYWAGLNKIYYLTTTGNNVLTVKMENWQGHPLTLRYNFFRLRDSINYTLDIGGYQSANILPDDFAFNNGMPFATYDRPDRFNCASNIHAGWWYNYCTYALPNGVFYFGGPYTPSGGFYDGIYYNDWMGYGYSLKFFSMAVSHT